MIKCNIGDAHAMGQAPMTYLRQVVSGAAYPELIDSANNNSVFPGDAAAQVGATVVPYYLNEGE